MARLGAVCSHLGRPPRASIKLLKAYANLSGDWRGPSRKNGRIPPSTTKTINTTLLDGKIRKLSIRDVLYNLQGFLEANRNSVNTPAFERVDADVKELENLWLQHEVNLEIHRPAPTTDEHDYAGYFRRAPRVRDDSADLSAASSAAEDSDGWNEALNRKARALPDNVKGLIERWLYSHELSTTPVQDLMDDLHKECGPRVNNDKELRQICLRYVNLVIRGDGYAHELASKIAEQKKNNKKEKKTRKKRTKRENLRSRLHKDVKLY